MKTILLTALLALSACGKSTHTFTPGENTTTTTIYLPGPTTTIAVDVPVLVTPPVTVPTAVQNLLADENDYRESLGQTTLTQGVTCKLYDLKYLSPLPSLLPVLSTSQASWVYKGEFNQDNSPASTGLQVLTPELRVAYPQWFAIRCTGYVAVLGSGSHVFSTNSDDASLLYINGAKVVDNDGQHGMQFRQGSLSLREGVYAFRLDYMEGNGPLGLIVNMDGKVLPKENLYR